jgi:hypothetical protein
MHLEILLITIFGNKNPTHFPYKITSDQKNVSGDKRKIYSLKQATHQLCCDPLQTYTIFILQIVHSEEYKQNSFK